MPDAARALVTTVQREANGHPLAGWPPAIAHARPEAWHAILQFFAAEVRNPNTRRAYLSAAEDFSRVWRLANADQRRGWVLSPAFSPT